MSVDRKRRLTGSSRDYAIDLTSPPRRRPRMPHSTSVNGRESQASFPNISTPSTSSEQPAIDVVLPKWQPDSEVGSCPICDMPFSFLYRKHHCRKCGRVVCWKCSPHRITIPQKYVVQPPGVLDDDASAAGLNGDPYLQRLVANQGAVVRVCNPCVPDPWTPGAGQEAAAGSAGGEQSRRDSRDAGQRYRPTSIVLPGTTSRAQPPQTIPNISRSVPHMLPAPQLVPRDSFPRHPPAPPSNIRSGTGHRYSRSNIDGRLPRLSPQHTRPAFTTPLPSIPVQTRPRRQVREEDECPVCGTELPPGENTREAHIQDCIAARFFTHASGPPAPPIPNPLSSSYRAPTAMPSSFSPPIADHSTTAEGSRPRATSYRPRGMALYRATEKDCTTEDGEPQECIICFEEFQPSEEMGRMECLCKFHRACIRQWWDTKGVGSCPTHQLHD